MGSLYSGDRINLAVTPGTTCSASSRYNAAFDCSHATDGKLHGVEGSNWTAGKRTLGEWIQVNKNYGQIRWIWLNLYLNETYSSCLLYIFRSNSLRWLE